MKFRISFAQKPKLSVKDAASFSTKDYECHFLLQTKRGQPVAVSEKKDPDCNIWKVQYGFVSMYFGTYAEAMDYCRKRFCDLSGKSLSR